MSVVTDNLTQPPILIEKRIIAVRPVLCYAMSDKQLFDDISFST